MTFNLKLLKEFSLRARSLLEVAKICWGDFETIFPYNSDDDDRMEKEIEKLLTHRQNALYRISRITSTLPEILGNELVNAVFCLQRGYSEALVCAELYRYGNDMVTLSPVRTGPYAAKNFIDPNGYFNELLWAKRFVSEKNTSVFCRFEVACFYCFEEVIRGLWFLINESGRHPYESSFSNLWIKFSYFVAIWVYQLENKFEALSEENENFASGFHVCGFKYSLSQGNEYAARFFWNGCTDTEKATWFNEMDEMDSEDLSNMAFTNCAGCVNFIYSLLSVDLKMNLFTNHNFIYNDDFFVWTCLLLSPFYKSALNDILTLSFPVSMATFRILLETLASKMAKLPIPDYGETFKALWKFLPQSKRIEFLEVESQVIRNFLSISAIDLLKVIIQPLPTSKKNMMLIFDWQFAGISAVDQFSFAGDYKALHQYLLFFLINIDPVTQKLMVRDDGLELLSKFINEKMFIEWTNGQVPKYEIIGVIKVIDSLQGSLEVLNTLRDQVEIMNFNKEKYKSFRCVVSGIDKRSENLKRSSEDTIQEKDWKKLKL